MTKTLQSKLVSIKDIAQEVGITERQVRKILRAEAADKKQHEYFWLFSHKEAKEVVRKLKKIVSGK